MPNLTDVSNPCALRGTPPPTQSPDAALFEVLFYLFALMCVDSTFCSGMFRLLCAALTWAGGAGVAYLPVDHLKRNAHSKSTIKCTKATMAILWLLSNLPGVYAYNATREHESKYADDDSLTKFEILI